MVSHSIRQKADATHFSQIHQPKLYPYCITMNKMLDTLAATFKQIKQNTCFKQKGATSTLRGKRLKLVGQFTYLDSNVSSTESDLTYTWRRREQLLTGSQSYGSLSDEIKRDFFQAVFILLYGCTTWKLEKRIKKKKDGNYTCCLEKLLEATAYKNSSCTVTYLPSHKPSK